MVIKSIDYGDELPTILAERLIEAIVRLRFTELGYDMVLLDVLPNDHGVNDGEV